MLRLSQGFEHLMQNLGIGDLSLPHPIDSHRPAGYQMPEVNYTDETITFETGSPDIAAAAAAAATTTTTATGMYSTNVRHTQFYVSRSAQLQSHHM